MVSHPTCCHPVLLDRRDGCDLLIDLKNFHLVAVARRDFGLVRNREPYNRFVGCPGCGVIAQGRWARGNASDLRTQGRDPSVNPAVQYGAIYAANTSPDCDLYRAEPFGVRPGLVWGRGQSVGRFGRCASRKPLSRCSPAS